MTQETMASTRTLADGSEPFEVTLVEAAEPQRTVLFAPGRGGRPEMYLALFEALAGRGCTVVAPHMAMMGVEAPRAGDLLSRLRRLAVAADAFGLSGLPIAGVGHSIGAALMLTLAGGRPWTLGEGPLDWQRRIGFEKLALITPATDFFGAPGALDAVRAPILAFAGSADTRTPPAKVESLHATIGPEVEVRVAEGAGHFTFMSELPPGIDDPHPDRARFLADFARDLGDFLAG
jgi:pimeloyl-ACP methyl ester carboxylesterase